MNSTYHNILPLDDMANLLMTETSNASGNMIKFQHACQGQTQVHNPSSRSLTFTVNTSTIQGHQTRLENANSTHSELDMDW